MTDSNSLPYLEALNPEQRRAVFHTGPALLILAGAGSGKTRVITTKIAYAVDALGVDPRSVLAVTFTNKAAGEMRERLANLTPAAEGAVIRTFHSFGAWLLRLYGTPLGIKPRFLIYDENDACALLKTGLKSRFDSREIENFFSLIMRAKDLCLGPNDDLSAVSRNTLLPEIYREYEERLRGTGNLDFGDLIMQNVLLLRQHEAARRQIQARFRMVLVDEYQDSNRAQFEFLKELVSPEMSLCVVGDDDQSIYGFRGAEVENILNFPEHFKDTEIIRLEENYRSTKTILAAASEVVACNRRRMGKTLVTANPAGDPISLFYFQNHQDEALYATKLVGENPGLETAIMYRMNYQSRVFEEFFSRRRIPYLLVGSVRFYEREEVKDVLAYLSFLVNPRDEVALRRIINKPPRGIGGQTSAALFDKLSADASGFDEELAAKLPSLAKRARQAVETFLLLIRDLRARLPATNLARFIHDLAIRTGLYDYHGARDSADGTVRLKNLEELVNAAAAYGMGEEAAFEFLENTMLVNPEYGDAHSSRVTLITLHNTKGLEFDRVIITGCEEGVFPVTQGFSSETDIEEERRLFYVGLTRARKILVLTSARNRLLFGKPVNSEPSRFLGEIPDNLLKKADFTLRLAKETSRFPRGSRVYSDDYGPGYVVKTKTADNGEVVTVRFDTGREVPIILKFHDLVRLTDD